MKNQGDDGSTMHCERVVHECGNFPGAELSYPFNEYAAVFKVGGKVFAIVSENEVPARVTLKCEPDYVVYLTQHVDDIVPGYHMNKRHWITITLSSSVPEDLVDELVLGSYELVLGALSLHARQAIAALGE